MKPSLFKKDLGNPFQILIYILIFYGVISFATMGSWGVIESSEARYAEISREMIQSSDWIHPTLLNIYHYHKPPIIYWITSVSLGIFGINGMGVRFFLQVALLVQIVLVYRIATILLGEKRQGLYAAIIYAGLPIVLISVRGLTTDAYLQTFILATILSWLQWKKSSGVLSLYLTSFFLSLAFLTKGPVALIIPAMTIIAFHKEYNNNHKKFLWPLWLSILFGILISISWFLYLAFEDKTFIRYFLFHHTVERFASGETFTRSQPWWYYMWVAPLVALPWIFIIPFAFAESRKLATPTIKKILLYWIGIPLIFFSISSSKLVLYVLPLYTGLAIVCGGLLNSITIKFKAFENTFFFSICFLSLALFISTLVIKSLNAGWIPLLAVGLVGLMILMKFAAHKTYIPKVLFYSLLWSGFLILFSSFLFSKNEIYVNSTKPIADWIIKNDLEDHEVIVYNQLLPSLAFELNKDIISVSNGDRHLNREIEFEKNDQWREALYNLTDTLDMERLETVLQTPHLLVSRGELADEVAWLKNGLTKKMKFGNWILFYN